MNTILKGLIITLSLAWVLVGCGTSPASKFYLLSDNATQFPSGSTPSLGVGPIEIPEYLNRNAIVYAGEGNRLHIANSDRWAEPLDSGVSRVISLNLASLLNTQDVQSYPWSKSTAPTYAVAVTVLNLDADDQGARLVAEWHLYKAHKREDLLRRVNKLDYAFSGSPANADKVAQAYSHLLLQLSEVIAEAITAQESKQASGADASI